VCYRRRDARDILKFSVSQMEAATCTTILHITDYCIPLYSDFHAVDIMIKMLACLSLRAIDTIQYTL